jgi:hypothetical protein
MTDRRYVGHGLETAAERLNPVLRGWSGYFRYGHSSKKFNAVDAYVAALHRDSVCTRARRKCARPRFDAVRRFSPLSRYRVVCDRLLLDTGGICRPRESRCVRSRADLQGANRSYHGCAPPPVASVDCFPLLSTFQSSPSPGTLGRCPQFAHSSLWSSRQPIVVQFCDDCGETGECGARSCAVVGASADPAIRHAQPPTYIEATTMQPRSNHLHTQGGDYFDGRITTG